MIHQERCWQTSVLWNPQQEIAVKYKTILLRIELQRKASQEPEMAMKQYQSSITNKSNQTILNQMRKIIQNKNRMMNTQSRVNSTLNCWINRFALKGEWNPKKRNWAIWQELSTHRIVYTVQHQDWCLLCGTEQFASVHIDWIGIPMSYTIDCSSPIVFPPHYPIPTIPSVTQHKPNLFSLAVTTESPAIYLCTKLLAPFTTEK